MVVVLLYNAIGLVMCFIPAALAAMACVYIPRGNDDIWTLVGVWGAVVFIWDVIYRIFNRDERWLSPNRGGHIFFAPVCVITACAMWWHANHALKVGYSLPRTAPNPNGILH
jgi:hypothetical protein